MRNLFLVLFCFSGLVHADSKFSKYFNISQAEFDKKSQENAQDETVQATFYTLSFAFKRPHVGPIYKALIDNQTREVIAIQSLTEDMKKDLKTFCPLTEKEPDIKCIQEILNQLTDEKRLSITGLILFDAYIVMTTSRHPKTMPKAEAGANLALALESTLSVMPKIKENAVIDSNDKHPEVKKLIHLITKENSTSITRAAWMNIELIESVIKKSLEQKDINKEQSKRLLDLQERMKKYKKTWKYNGKKLPPVNHLSTASLTGFTYTQDELDQIYNEAISSKNSSKFLRASFLADTVLQAAPDSPIGKKAKQLTEELKDKTQHHKHSSK